MLLTEEEYRKKWCPHTRTLGTLRQPAKPGDPDFVVGSGGQNRGYAMDLPLDKCLCIASDCSQWRWAGKSLLFRDWENEGGEMEGEAKTLDPSPDGVPRGFCGLAGKP